VITYVTQIFNKNIKRNGPKTDPWGSPESKIKGDEGIQEKRTQDCLLVKELTNQFK
jgi:hypothetical protein